MVLLENDMVNSTVIILVRIYFANAIFYLQFLTELTKLFKKARAASSVSITFKRCT